MVNHKKAGDWIPPGGHIEPEETPIHTIKREMKEELNFSLASEKIELFNLSIKQINNPKQICKIHYDFWYLIFIKKQNFMFDKKEFHDGGWFGFDEALNIVKTSNYNRIIRSLLTFQV